MFLRAWEASWRPWLVGMLERSPLSLTDHRQIRTFGPSLGPPVERLEYGYSFSIVYFSRETLPENRHGKRPQLGDLVWTKPFRTRPRGARVPLACSLSRNLCLLSFRNPLLRVFFFSFVWGGAPFPGCCLSSSLFGGGQ